MMEELKYSTDEEKQAKVEIWKYVCGFTPMAVVKCAIDLQIADVLEIHGGTMTLADLSAAVGCSPPFLRRIMRYLVYRRFFKQTLTGQESSISYTQSPLSKLLLKNGENSMAAIILLHSSMTMIAPLLRLSSGALENGVPPFEDAHGRNVWEYASANPAYNKLFNDGMACVARQSMEAFIEKYPKVFNGIASLVDVGGGDGRDLAMVVKAFPWIHGINFDQPHVASVAPHRDDIEHVAGNMFDVIPKVDAVFIMRVLHGWNDEKCIDKLKKYREAIPTEKGKVIIAEAVIGEGEDDAYSDARLALNMLMLALTTNGKERSFKEWEYVVKEAGLSRITVKNIDNVIAVIEAAYPRFVISCSTTIICC